MEGTIYKVLHNDWERILSTMYQHNLHEGWMHVIDGQLLFMNSEQLSDGSFGAHVTREQVLNNIISTKNLHDVGYNKNEIGA